jgi:hypothetical protein
MSQQPEDAESDEEECCPLCGQEASINTCAHLLANFDLTFAGQGELGAGLGGGELYGLDEVHSLLDHVQSECASALATGDQARISQLKSIGEPLTGYVAALLAADFDAGGSPDDFPMMLVEEVCEHPTCVRELLEAMLAVNGVVVGYTFSELDDMPGQSSAYEAWWTNDPEAASRGVAELAAKALKSLR